MSLIFSSALLPMTENDYINIFKLLEVLILYPQLKIRPLVVKAMAWKDPIRLLLTMALSNTTSNSGEFFSALQKFLCFQFYLTFACLLFSCNIWLFIGAFRGVTKTYRGDIFGSNHVDASFS